MKRSLRFRAPSAAVLVVDSLELRRIGIVSLLKPWADESDIRIIAIGPAEALAHSDTSFIKMIVLVLGRRGISDAEPHNWITSLQARYSNTPLVLVADHVDSEEVVAAFRAGARGFVPMTIAPSVAIEAFKFIMSGGSFFPPAALVRSARVTASLRVRTTQTTIIGAVQKTGLTLRQHQVLERLRLGDSNKLIARQLKLRESTVKVHIRQIMRKLGATNRTQAALSAGQLPPLTHDETDRNEGD